MTGIERLREFVAGISPFTVVRGVTSTAYDREHMEVAGVRLRDFLADVADRIEREHTEDREAIAWVREHGGIDYVKKEWRSRVPYDRYERRRQRLLGHIAECEAALGRRREIISKLTHHVKALANENVELRRRAMPEGMEWLLEVWPKWSNGEYCRFGDWWKSDKYGESEPKQLRKLSIYTPEQLDEWGQGDGESFGYEWDFMRPSELDYRPDKVEPPAPSVLASDGEPLEVGQTVWDVDAEADTPLTIVEVSSDLVRCEYTWKDGKTYRPCYPPDQLTHQRPVADTWERLEEEARSCTCVMEAIDLVLRCKALAEKENRNE